mmetsp:Transcript_7601/g.14104  ORF Transcript_7601/g.14104 Transcript_7601/m.14104 type:complete len:249 (+) Transcript_7601:35-781(+)
MIKMLFTSFPLFFFLFSFPKQTKQKTTITNEIPIYYFTIDLFLEKGKKNQNLLAVVVLVKCFDVDSPQHLSREESKQRPGQVQRVENSSRLVSALGNKLLLELSEELQVEQVLITQGFLTHDRLHGEHVFTNRIAGIHLVRHLRVVVTGHAFTDGTLHQTTQRGQDVHRRENLPIVQLPVNVDLSLSNVTREIRNWVSDIIVRHGEDWELSNGAFPSFNSSRPLVDRRKICVHITRVTSPSGHLLSRS